MDILKIFRDLAVTRLSQNAGKLAAADASAKVKLNYVYTATTGPSQMAITNQLLGTTPLFSAAEWTRLRNPIVRWRWR